MATKRLTDTGIANLNPPAAGRLEIWDAIVPGLGLRVGARRKTFVVMARAEGRLRWVSLGVFPGMGVAEARKKAREIIEQAQNGIDPVEARREARVVKTQQRANTISATVEEYIERYAKPRQRSWLQTKRRLEIYLVDELGDRPVSSLTRADIVRVLDGVQEKGFAIGANRTLANIKTYLRWCAERGLIERSPADLLRSPSPEVSRDRVLTDKEPAAVWHASLSAGYPYGDIVRLLILTGQRREELVAECVKTEEMHSTLAELGSDYLRVYLFARPVSSAELIRANTPQRAAALPGRAAASASIALKLAS